MGYTWVILKINHKLQKDHFEYYELIFMMCLLMCKSPLQVDLITTWKPK
jgi:hypothetical protein